MLNHTKKIKEIYEKIQKMIFYMIPEKWEKIYLYSSILDIDKNKTTGELFFYYIPKGLLRKKIVNVYQIPNKFNIEENDYLPLVESLYSQIKLLREEFKKADKDVWSNITIIINNSRLRVEYDYENLNNSDFTSYERHVIWRYNYLKIGPEQVNKKDREILKRYILGAKKINRREIYEFGIYLKDINNIVDYTTKPNNLKEEKSNEIKSSKEPKLRKNEEKELTIEEQIQKQRMEDKKIRKNQILLAQEIFDKKDSK